MDTSIIIIGACIAIAGVMCYGAWKNCCVVEEEPVAPVKAKRARNKKGQLKADDPSTPKVNEAWVGGKAPKKRGRPKGSKNKPKK